MIRLLKTKEAAEYLGLSVRTLENWRYQGRPNHRRAPGSYFATHPVFPVPDSLM